jgi:hydrogenase maturation protein HypF
VRGTAPGEGFRPFTYRLATELGLGGWVRCADAGVLIEVEGAPSAVEAFQQRLHSELPPRIHVESVTEQEQTPHPTLEPFRIEPGGDGDEISVPITPDLATCPECLQEIFEPRNRRFRYPFTTCAHCGPRFTIALDAPYDRSRTTMAPFQMCAHCRAETEDPSSRRYRCATNACPECGPAYWIEPSPPPLAPGDVIDDVAQLLRDGQILAIKGIGGFHLVCLAEDEDAVARLRRRKHREAKPMAVMVGSPSAVERIVELTLAGRALLLDRSAPIVVARKRPPESLAPSVAPDSAEYGVMLPYTPFYHLLMATIGEPLVVTSANVGGEAILTDNEDARAQLAQLADTLVLHDRRIHMSCDDSVVLLESEGPVPVRRSRGSAPSPVVLRRPLPPTLALGGALKAAVGVAKGRGVYLSQHLGDLASASAVGNFHRTVEHMLRSWSVEPELVAHDLHPHSHGYAVREQFGGHAVGVQHHHAHMAGVMAEHGLSGPVVGVCLDGGGYGVDGSVWGGEFLVGDAATFTRAASLPAFRIPATERVPHPWRSALGLLWDLLGDDAAQQWAQRSVRDLKEANAALAVLRTDGGCVPTTSLGRVYDAVAAILGICSEARFDAQAAMRLEREAGPPRPLDEPRLPDPQLPGLEYLRAVLEQLLACCREPLDPGRSRAACAAWAQAALARWTAATAVQVARAHRLDTVVASGGCLVNTWLRAELRRQTRGGGLTLCLNRLVPAGDGGLALGQLYVAAAKAAA